MKVKNVFITAAIVAAVVTSCVVAFISNSRAYKLGIEEIKESEMSYFATKSELMTEVENYIHSVAPTSSLGGYALVDECEYELVSLPFVLAQGEIESYFGTKGLASRTNSVWNVGAFDNLTYTQILTKYKYRTPNEAIRPYLEILKKRYLTSEVEEGLLKNFVDIDGNRYASDPHYEERLRAKYQYIKEHTKIDSLESELKYWAVKANRN